MSVSTVCDPIRKVVVILLFCLLAGCSYVAEEQHDADRMVARLHQAISAHEYATMLSLYDSSFFQVHDKGAWQAYWQALVEQEGEIQSIRPLFSQADARYRGDYYVYGYKLVFQHRTLVETISVFKGIEGGQLRILGHVIEAE